MRLTWTGAVGLAVAGVAVVAAATVVYRTEIDLLAGLAVSCQLGPGQVLAGAVVSSLRVGAGVLAGAVAVVGGALVHV